MALGMVGTGKGSDVIISFNLPASSRRRFSTEVLMPSYSMNWFTPSHIHGVRNPIPTNDYKWMNEEEWLAVLLTNIYMSAGGSIRLRGGYGDYDQRLEPPENTSTGF